jgi:hypothetical protein
MKRCGRLLGRSAHPALTEHPSALPPPKSLAGLIPATSNLQPTSGLSAPDRLESKQRLHDLSP